MRPFDDKNDRRIPVIVADNHLQFQMHLGGAFASISSGVTRGVLLIDDLGDFLVEHDIQVDDENISHAIAEVIGMYHFINGFSARFGPAKVEAWHKGMLKPGDFVMRIDEATSKLTTTGSTSDTKSSPIADIEAEREKLYDTILPTLHHPPIPPSLPKAMEGDRRKIETSLSTMHMDLARPVMKLPEEILVALMMMLGEDKIIIRTEDMRAAETWRRGRQLEVFVQQDPHCIIVKLEE